MLRVIHFSKVFAMGSPFTFQELVLQTLLLVELTDKFSFSEQFRSKTIQI